MEVCEIASPLSKSPVLTNQHFNGNKEDNVHLAQWHLAQNLQDLNTADILWEVKMVLQMKQLLFKLQEFNFKPPESVNVRWGPVNGF